MSQTISTEKMKIELGTDRIVIDDKHGRNLRYLMIYHAIAVLGIAFHFLLEGITTGGITVFLTIFAVLNAIGLLFLFFKRSGKKEIELSEISSINYKKRDEREGLDIKLKNGKTRKILNLETAADEVITFFQGKSFTINRE